MEVNKIIKQRRLELNLTLKDLAEALNVATSTVSRYETSDIQNMGIDKIESLAKVLQCTPAYLMGWTDDKNSLIIQGNNNNSNLVQGNNSRNLAISNTRETEKSEIETELIDICHNLTMREKTNLLSYAYSLLDKTMSK